MNDADRTAGGAAVGEQPSEEHPVGEQPSEEELRAAYEAELNRITSAELIIQTVVSLINIAGRRLGLSAAVPPGNATAPERDLEQARDAIDGASALVPILERRIPREIGPLRDAISQLQMAYAREAQSVGASRPSETTDAPAQATADEVRPADQTKPADGTAGKPDAESPAPGPAQASGRLWVPGR